MQDKYFEALELLASIAGDYGVNSYRLMNTALGVIPFKNKVNMSVEIGTGFTEIAHWLVSEAEKNFNECNGVN